MVFTEFLEMVGSKFSADMVDNIIDDSNLPGGGAYTASLPAADLTSLRILLVDDHPINRLMTRSQLKLMGCAPMDEAENGLVALDYLRRNAYDVVLMDMQMPEMDGLEATRALRQMVLQSQPVVIAMTATAFTEDRDACMDAGMDHFLSKPVKIDVLRATLGAVLLGHIAHATQ